MAKILAIIIPALIGTVIVVNGVMIKGEDAIASAYFAANQMNVRQLDNALELYYSNHNAYPPVFGGEALSEILFDEGYIRNKPLEPSAIIYEPINEGQDYSLSLTKQPATNPNKF